MLVAIPKVEIPAFIAHLVLDKPLDNNECSVWPVLAVKGDVSRLERFTVPAAVLVADFDARHIVDAGILNWHFLAFQSHG